MSEISNNFILSFCLFSLKSRLSISESLKFVLRYFLFESRGLSTNTDFFEPFPIKGLFITSQKPSFINDFFRLNSLMFIFDYLLVEISIVCDLILS